MPETKPAEPEVGIPALEYRAPDCPLCGDETSHDGDSLYCEACQVHWPDPHGEGQRIYAYDTPACGAEFQPYVDSTYERLRPWRFRCVLDAKHSAKNHAGVRVDQPWRHQPETHQWPKKPGDRYPSQITVFCEECGVEHTGDYLVSDACNRTMRLGYARQHMVTLGWRCDETGDWCPKHKHLPDEEEA